MEFELLKDVIVILGLSILVIYLFHKFKIPSIVGFLLTGIITGPSLLGWVHGVEEVEMMAEIGVILLLFTIGIEFSIENFLRIKKSVLIGGSLQVFITIIAAFLIIQQFGFDFRESVFAGFLVALSSTAIVLKIIQSKGEIGSLHGQTSLAILIFQDIIVVPMILITPFLAGTTNQDSGSVWEILVKVAGIIVFMYIAAKWIVPLILHQIAKTQNRELFLLTIIVIGFAVAWVTSTVGLSLALGAFIAGLIISESKFSEQAIGNIIPFRDVFTSFFFVSVGMLLNLDYLISNPVIVILITIGVLLLKTIITGFVAFIMGFPFRTTVIVGLTLSQIGEFSFILSKFGLKYDLISGDRYQLFLAVSVLSLAVTPFIINAAPRLSNFILKFNIPKKLRCGLQNIPETTDTRMSGHLVIIGYGINGKNVAFAAKHAGIAHLIIEMNPDTVKREQSKGEIIIYGDATQEEVLKHANIEHAMILVVTIPFPADARRITSTARQLNPNIHIIIRTRFVQDMKKLYELGADEVIPEEFETSIEIFTRVLAKLLIEREEIEKLVAKVRGDNYEMFRSLSTGEPVAKPLAVNAPKVSINTIHLSPESPLVGKPLSSCSFIKNRKLNLLAISRDGETINAPSQRFVLNGNDVLFFLDPFDHIDEVVHLFRAPEQSSNQE